MSAVAFPATLRPDLGQLAMLDDQWRDDETYQGVRAHWSFTEGGGRRVWDISGWGEHGDIVGTFAWLRTELGIALDVGIPDYVSVPNAMAEVTGNIGTLVVWVANINAYDSNGCIFFGDGVGVFCQIASPGSGNVYVFGAEINMVPINNYLNNGPHCFTFTTNGQAGGMRFYADGVETGSPTAQTPNSFTAGPKTIELGRWVNPSWGFDGQFAEVTYFHNRVFTEAEVLNDFRLSQQRYDRALLEQLFDCLLPVVRDMHVLLSF